jgi:hypothetical protein
MKNRKLSAGLCQALIKVKAIAKKVKARNKKGIERTGFSDELTSLIKRLVKELFLI